MFYEPSKRNHGLPYDPFKALVTPRPIGWISTVNAKGQVNLAPYSFFNAVGSRPPVVGFSSEGWKDSAAFAEETGEFVCSLSNWDLRDAMNATCAPLPRGVSEMEAAGIEAAPSRMVKPPRVAASPWALECKWLQTVHVKDLEGKPTDAHFVLGLVVGVYIDDRYIKDGIVNTAAMKPIARCGYNEYAVVTEMFTMVRPG